MINEGEYRTVAIPIDDYKVLESISNSEGRSLARQVSQMINQYNQLLQNPKNIEEDVEPLTDNNVSNSTKNILSTIDELKNVISSAKTESPSKNEGTKDVNNDLLSMIKELKNEIAFLKNEQIINEKRIVSEINNFRKEFDDFIESKISFKL